LDRSGVAIKGRLKDLSAHGLAVITSEELAAGSMLRVEWGSNVFDGRSIYCEQHGREFHTGIGVDGRVYDARQDANADDTDPNCSDGKVFR
jgi:hypothetical protein